MRGTTSIIRTVLKRRAASFYQTEPIATSSSSIISSKAFVSPNQRLLNPSHPQCVNWNRPGLTSSKFPVCSSFHWSLQLAQSRCIHTTPPNGVPPLLSLIIRPIVKLMAVVFGRGFRNWYFSLPGDKQRRVYDWFMRNRAKLGVGVCALGGLTLIYYYTHLEYTPITHRRRFIVLNEAQHDAVCKYEFDMLMSAFKDCILPQDSFRVERVYRVARKLLAANNDLPPLANKKWSVVVVEAPAIKNAMVLPTGEIFIFSGILDSLANDDQLAVILGHEMAHVVMDHGREQYSWSSLVDWLVISGLAVIWALMPSIGIAFITHWFFEKCVDIATKLPYSRVLESEADQIGLAMAGKACYDVREAYVYWSEWDLEEKIGKLSGIIPIPQMLQSHPNHGDRAERLDELVPKVLELRATCNCPPLPSFDPRIRQDAKKKLFNQQMAMKWN